MTERDTKIIRWIEENKSMTIYHRSKIFYPGNTYGYDQVRKRLRKLNQEGLIKRYRKGPQEEAIYYLNKILKPHNLNY
jgi:predicted HTH transcriptional regulator